MFCTIVVEDNLIKGLVGDEKRIWPYQTYTCLAGCLTKWMFKAIPHQMKKRKEHPIYDKFKIV